MVENLVILFLHANWPSMTRFNAKVLLNCAEGLAIEAKRTNQRKLNLAKLRSQGSRLFVPTERERRVV